MPNLIGQTLLNQFRVDSFVASGSMGAVYRVIDLQRNVPLAMKVLHAELADDASIFKRFQREAQALRKLKHPNIVPFYGLYQDQGLTFLLEAFIPGSSLQDILRQNKSLPLDEAMVYMKGLCAALGYAHSHDIVHCDVKPGNVMVSSHGDIYLTDFGIAKFIGATTTATMGVAGTPAYMAPEQIVGHGITSLTDIYALGVVLFEMLAGQRPFRGTEPETEAGGSTPSDRIRYGHLRVPPPNPRQINPGISPALAQVVLRALEKNPARRFQSAVEFFQALCYIGQTQPEQVSDTTTFIGQYEEAPPAPIPQTPDRPRSTPSQRRKNIALVFIIGAFAALLLLGVAIRGSWMSIPGVDTLTPPSLITTVNTRIITAMGMPLTETVTETVTPTSTFTVTPHPSTYDLAFVSDRDKSFGNLRAIIVNSSNLNDYVAFENPPGYEQAEWPSFCGEKLAIEAIDTDHSKRQWIYLHDLTSPSSAPVEWNHARNATQLGVPRCSPDGRYIAYSAYDESYDFFIAQIGNGKIIYEPDTRSYGIIAGYASWIFDSSSIIFTVIKKEGDTVVMRAALDSPDPSTLDLGRASSHAAISPDGKKIAFACSNSENLCVFDTITRNTQEIFDTHWEVKVLDWAEKVTPIWSMDGQWIYFATVDGGDWDIFRIHSDGSGVENVTRDWDSNELIPATR